MPSDLLGTWVFSINADRASKSEGEIAKEIYEIYLENNKYETKKNYFDYVNGWNQLFINMSENNNISDQDMCEYIIIGVLAAYYYMDNHSLYKLLERLSGSETLNNVILFGKTYIEVFLDSENMTKMLSHD